MRGHLTIHNSQDLLGQHDFGYDTLNRLTSATHPTLAAESFTYDGVGNRLAAIRGIRGTQYLTRRE
ncbi:MAG: hypothetical protein HY597_02375 [Candidatus Omnitrophica bacterium]|nr:hypothetical protein [Candidatus Omnitrophota bacterium]